MSDGSAGGVAAWLTNLAYTGGSLCAGVLLLLYFFQDKLLYFPGMPGPTKFTKDNPPGYRHPGEFDIDYEDVVVRASDGVHVHAWLMKQPDSATRPTMIFFHGNAGNIGYRLPNAVHLYHKVQCNILLVDYRGFGNSEGEPTEAGLKLDAEAMVDAMTKRDDIDPKKLVVFGRSLGGAVSLYIAQKAADKIAGVILENTFLSIGSMVDALMPVLSYVKPLVLRIDWNNERVVPTISHPILFVAGVQDELVPHSHMKRLHALATASRSAIWHAVPNGTHNDTWLRGGDKYFAAVRRFLESLDADDATTESPETCDAPTSPRVDTAKLEEKTHEGTIPNMLQQPLFSALQGQGHGGSKKDD